MWNVHWVVLKECSLSKATLDAVSITLMRKKGRKRTWRVATHTRNLCSAFNPSKCTHTAVSSEQTHKHTHTVNTHPEQWAAIYAVAPGEKLGVRCLAQGSHLSHGIEGGESAWTFTPLPPPTIPAGPETRTHALWVTSPTLYLLGHDCPREHSLFDQLWSMCVKNTKHWLK